MQKAATESTAEFQSMRHISHECIVDARTPDAAGVPGRSHVNRSRRIISATKYYSEIEPTNYRARPADLTATRALVAADRWLVRSYSFLKRYTPLGDKTVSRILKRFSR